MSDDRQMTEAGYGRRQGFVDLTVGCIVSQIGYFSSFINRTEYQICDTKFIIRVTYTRTW